MGVLADTGSLARLRFHSQAVHSRGWRAVGGNTLQSGHCKMAVTSNALSPPRPARGRQNQVGGIGFPLTVSWFWQTGSKAKLRCRLHLSLLWSLSGSTWTQTMGDWKRSSNHRSIVWAASLWTIHKARVYQWLVWFGAYLLVHWIHQSTLLPQLDWKLLDPFVYFAATVLCNSSDICGDNPYCCTLSF